MHELAITQSILDAAERHAAQAGAVRVRKLYLVIGELSSFVDDSVRFYWDFMSKGTICEGAVLDFQRMPARMLCLDCGTEYTLSGELKPCPGCKSGRIKVTGGDEFRLDSMDIETANPEESAKP